jgi:predicted nucleic acid-binding protein
MTLAVLDTNVVVSAMRPRAVASFRILRELAGKAQFQIAISVPLVMEYEMALKRLAGLEDSDAEALVDYLCEVGEKREIHFLWRPFLGDPKDEIVLEVAVEAGVASIVTHNVRGFQGVEERFGIRIIWPGAFLLDLEGREG